MIRIFTLLILTSLFMACADLYPVQPGQPPLAGAGATTGPLSIRRIELTFDNGRADITVPRNARLAARAKIAFDGNGLFRAIWVVDDAQVELVNRTINHGATIELETSVTTPLPTFSPGQHRLSLHILEPATTMTSPVIRYVVTTEEGAAR